MKKTLLAVVASVVALSFALPAFAEEAKKEVVKPAGPKPHQYTGEITAVDAATKSVTVKNKDGEAKTFACSDKCKISTAVNKAAELADVKVGDKVHVVYTEEGGKNVASKIGPPPVPKEKKAHEDKKS